jgi:2'-5' RNA ligase
MAVIRAFIAIDLPAAIQGQLDSISNQLQAQVKPGTVRWVPARNIHLTLKFLGEVSSTNLEMLTNLLQIQAARQPCFDLSVGNLGAFPTIHRPRVIWIGVQAPANLHTLQRTIESETLRLGYTAEDRPFSAHLTLGRVSHNAQPPEITRLGEQLSAMKVGNLGSLRVDAVRLYRSDLQPGGAVYSQLFSAALAS